MSKECNKPGIPFSTCTSYSSNCEAFTIRAIRDTWDESIFNLFQYSWGMWGGREHGAHWKLKYNILSNIGQSNSYTLYCPVPAHTHTYVRTSSIGKWTRASSIVKDQKICVKDDAYRNSQIRKYFSIKIQMKNNFGNSGIQWLSETPTERDSRLFIIIHRAIRPSAANNRDAFQWKAKEDVFDCFVILFI